MNEEPIKLIVEFQFTREEMSALESYTDEANHKRHTELFHTTLREELTHWKLKELAHRSVEYYIRQFVDEKIHERIAAFTELSRQQTELDAKFHEIELKCRRHIEHKLEKIMKSPNLEKLIDELYQETRNQE